MLSVSDLIDINYIPAEDEISLQLLVDFYEEYLCKKIFIFTLKDGKVIKLFFRDATEIFHLSGIDHVYEGIPMDGKRFVQVIKNRDVDLKIVESINAAAYKDYIIRIRSMACLDTIIKNCEYLWFPDGKIPGSEIEVRYLLLKGLDDKNLHLGIDTYKENKPYYSRTLLVTEGNNSDKFIEKAEEKLRVAKLEIRDKDTDELLLCIDREAAERIALDKIRAYVDEWFCDDFQVLFIDHLVEKVSCRLFDLWEQKLNFEVLQKAIMYDSEMKTAIEMNDSSISKTEWKEFFVEILSDKLSDTRFVDQVFPETLYEIEDYVMMLHDSVNRVIRDNWKATIKRKIDEKKEDIRCAIEEFDCYTSGRILGETIRNYEKEELNEKICQKLTEFIIQKGSKVICEILNAEIIKQKERVLKKIILLLS